MKIGDRVQIIDDNLALRRYLLRLIADAVAGGFGFVMAGPHVEDTGIFWTVSTDVLGQVRIEENHMRKATKRPTCFACGSFDPPTHEMSAGGLYWACSSCKKPV